MTVSPIAETIENNLNQTCEIYSYIINEGGSITYLTPSRTAKCRITNKTSKILSIEGEVLTTSTTKIMLPANDVVTIHDRIVIDNVGIDIQVKTINIVPDQNGLTTFIEVVF